MKAPCQLLFAIVTLAGAGMAGVSAELPTTVPASTTAPQTAESPPPLPAATTREVGNDERRKYLLALWAQQREKIVPQTAPLSSRRTGIAVETPAFQDGSPSGATLVSVHGSGTLLHALIQVAESGNVRIGANAAGLFHRGGTSDITLDLTRKPLWEAIYEICSAGGLDVVSVESPFGAGTKHMAPGATGQIILGEQPPGHTMGIWSTNGPFLYEVQRLEHSIGWENGTGEEHRLEMVLRAWAEPKLRVLAGPGRIVLDQVIDENENSLIPLDAQTGDTNSRGDIRIRLAVPENAGRKIAHFRATDRCLIQRASEHLEFAAPEKSVTRMVGGMDLLVETEHDANSTNVYQISLTVGRGERDEVDWAHLREVMDDLNPQLLNAAGVPLRFFFARKGSSGADGQAVSQYAWIKESPGGAALTPAKLVFEIPTDVKAIDVPIAFDNLPLP